MEDSSFMDLMIDTDEYLIDDWESDFPVSGKSATDHQNTKPCSESGSGFGLVPGRPAKQMKANNNNKVNSTSSSPSSSSGSQVISFGSGDPKTNLIETSLNFSNIANMDQKVGTKRKDCGNNNGGRREPHLLKEHVLAERKRRQKLNERLIALSALLPGLKKVKIIHKAFLSPVLFICVCV